MKVLIVHMEGAAGHEGEIVDLPAGEEARALAELRRLAGPSQVFLFGDSEEQLLRCSLLLQRKGQMKMEFGDISLDLLRRRAFRAGKEIFLKANEFSLLELFLRQPDRVLSKKEILRRIWGYSFDPGTNVVDVLVHRLRKKLDLGFPSSLITTVKGRGYSFCAG